ncbi:L,D-transpeptidase family protein [Candidatus Woesearchaeota archaeon]|nr:L,D-transpeptidase family protein [Candidatus Woesearchaeota archaeon]
MNRRDFMKASAMLSAGLVLDPQILVPEHLEQKVLVNIPSYELKLFNYVGNKLNEQFTFMVGVGRGRYWRKPTPITTGQIIDKRPMIHFFFEHDKPERGAKKGEVMYDTWTFDDQGNSLKLPMPYDKMRGLGTLMKMPSGYMNPGYVIHSTSDAFTIGLPCSNGCIRVGIDDMLRLYDLVAPDAKKKGPREQIPLKSPIPLETLYDVVEVKENKLLLHADIYNKEIDYFKEFQTRLVESHIFQSLSHDSVEKIFDLEKVKKEIADSQEQFKDAHKKILLTLIKEFPNNYPDPELKTRLHRTYKLKDFFKPET